MSKESKNTYNQIFDFLFNIQESKQTLNVKRDPKFGGLGNALLEIGTQPAIYPVEVTLEEIKKTIEKESSVQMGNERKFSATIFTPPSEISKQINSHVMITPVSTKEMADEVVRPSYVVLDNFILRLVNGYQMPTWQESLQEYIKEIKED